MSTVHFESNKKFNVLLIGPNTDKTLELLLLILEKNSAKCHLCHEYIHGAQYILEESDNYDCVVLNLDYENWQEVARATVQLVKNFPKFKIDTLFYIFSRHNLSVFQFEKEGVILCPPNPIILEAYEC